MPLCLYIMYIFFYFYLSLAKNRMRKSFFVWPGDRFENGTYFWPKIDDVIDFFPHYGFFQKIFYLEMKIISRLTCIVQNFMQFAHHLLRFCRGWWWAAVARR